MDPRERATRVLGRPHVEAAVDQHQEAKAAAGVDVGGTDSPGAAIGQLHEPDARHL